MRLLVDTVTNTTSRVMVKGPGNNYQWVKIFQRFTILFSDPHPGIDSLKMCQLLHQTIRQDGHQHAGQERDLEASEGGAAE